ncbi:MAG: hypothetical protein QOD14_132 [Solirubrobacterales bacterium]|jgi:hypothetical protein|nr:hypothetical protein [Solirubrobacterales bacterium]
MAIGLGTRQRRAVSLDEGAPPDATRCPACGEPLFAWVETLGYGTREDQVIDRCENCGLVVARDAVPSPDPATDELLTGQRERDNRVAIRADNAASLQAWLGAENWAALRPGGHRIKPTPRAASLLLARRGLEVRRVRHLARPGMASMWQTLLNLLTFHRDFASEAVSGRLRPGTGRGLAAFWIDAAVTVLAAIPTAIIAVVLEGFAVLARRGGVIEVEADRLPPTE